MEKIWTTLIKEAKNKINTHEIEPFIEYGNNSCAILTKDNNIYTGVNITSNSSINTSAEKSAVLNMINNGETKIVKMVILNELEEIISPSIQCLDYLLELSETYGEVEVLLNESGETATVLELLPDWWGTYRNSNWCKTQKSTVYT